MAREEFPRKSIKTYPIIERENRMLAPDDLVFLDHEVDPLSEASQRVLALTVERLRIAREKGAARMLFFGAHAIKNGLAPILMWLIENKWITHLATNGAGIIHDFELTTLGATSEHVAANVATGRFGIWTETINPINMAICAGALEGLGYGESVGKALLTGKIEIPSPQALCDNLKEFPAKQMALRAILATHMDACGLTDGYFWEHDVPFCETCGLQASAYDLGVPLTAHVMFGHDIIYTSPRSCGALIGEAAERDFLCFANSVSNLEDGVYISVGSAVASPMCFEKSMSMTNNLRIQEGKGPLTSHTMIIVDLDESRWDWTQGEPPEDNSDYYLRFNKSFSRMGGQMAYAEANNVQFILGLARALMA